LGDDTMLWFTVLYANASSEPLLYLEDGCSYALAYLRITTHCHYPSGSFIVSVLQKHFWNL
jgi:hypothetical protein